MSFKPENLHPLAGIAIPTMIREMMKQTNEQLELFTLFEVTSIRLKWLSIAISGSSGVTIGLALSRGFVFADATLLFTLFVLAVWVNLCRRVIDNLKWTAYDKGKAFHEATTQIITEFYGEEVLSQ